MEKKICLILGSIGVILLLLGFSGFLYKNTQVNLEVTPSQIVKTIQTSEAYQELNTEGLQVGLNRNNIVYTYKDYSFTLIKNDTILSSNATSTLDKLLFALTYDSVGVLYDYQEGDIYATAKNNTYTLEQGISISDSLKMDISKKPIYLKNTSVSLITNEIKVQFNQIVEEDEVQKFIQIANEYNTMYQEQNGQMMTNQDIDLSILAVTTPSSCDKLYYDETGQIAFENCAFTDGNYHYSQGNLTKISGDSLQKSVAEAKMNAYIEALLLAQNQYYLSHLTYPNTYEELTSSVGEINMVNRPVDCTYTFQDGKIELDDCHVVTYSMNKTCSYHDNVSCE